MKTIAVFSLWITGALAGAAAPAFTFVGDVVFGVSGDGQYVIGQMQVAPGTGLGGFGIDGFRYDVSSGETQMLGFVPTDISSDGQFVVGRLLDGTPYQFLNGVSAPFSDVPATVGDIHMAEDSRRVFGTMASYDSWYYKDVGEPAVIIPRTPEFLGPAGMSGDGAIIVGSDGMFQTRLLTPSGMIEISEFGAAGISADGSTLFGYSRSRQSQVLYRGGTFETVPADSAILVGVSRDGGIVLGDANFPYQGREPHHPFLWSQTIGLIDLNELVTLDPGWTLVHAIGISDDGSVVVGLAYDSTGATPRGFVLSGLAPAAVPEPAGMGLAAVALLLGLIFWRGVSLKEEKPGCVTPT